MKYWKALITMGNTQFAANELNQALVSYQQALNWAQVLFQRWAVAHEAVSACVVTQHNLADLYRCLGQPEQAAEQLCNCHRHLLQTITACETPPALRAAALRQSRQSYSALLEFRQEQGPTPSIDALLAHTSEGYIQLPAHGHYTLSVHHLH